MNARKRRKKILKQAKGYQGARGTLLRSFHSNQRQVAGAKIIISWENNEEEFFTGLKPEVGNGYADFAMSPSVTYSLRLAVGSDIAEGLTAPACQPPSGETYLGGLKLTFQQP